MAQTQVILLERVESLGNMGDTVAVKPGFARNYLLPQGKALRATKDNIAYFEAQKAALQAENDKKRGAAEKEAKKVEGITVSIIRQASESGRMFGSVTARDIADAVSETSGLSVSRSQVVLNQNFKVIGLFPVSVSLHPEVKAEVTVNIARTSEEAKIQQETGRALIAEAEEVAEEEAAPVEELEQAISEDAPAAEDIFEEPPAAEEDAAEDANKESEASTEEAEDEAAKSGASS